jgi:oxygen-independent coproporphyrinogen-3 oxidase
MAPAGIYIHIPFCRSRCSYCDFATGIFESGLADRYVRAVAKEIQSWKEIERAERVDTIYFGGGTPSLLSIGQVAHILEAVYERFSIDTNPELTMEMNPGIVGAPEDRSAETDSARSLQTLHNLRCLGVNRASFGAQTFDDRELARLGRSHTAADTRQTFRSLREAGFQNVSFDLIAGLPGQNLAGWKRNLDESLNLAPEHLSFYLLEVHQGTPLAAHINRGIQPTPDDDLAAEMYQLMLDQAGAAGYEHYEISNLCLPGLRSRHNIKYWMGAPYYGFGCSAHSYDGKMNRWSNERDVARYTEMIEQGQSPIVESLTLSRDEARSEGLFLGLRMMQGVNVQNFQESFGADLRQKYREEFSRFKEAGLVEFDGDVIKLTRSGALLSNEVFAAFV